MPVHEPFASAEDYLREIINEAAEGENEARYGVGPPLGYAPTFSRIQELARKAISKLEESS